MDKLYVIDMKECDTLVKLLLHESEAKQRMSVNDKDIIRIYVGYNWLIN